MSSFTFTAAGSFTWFPPQSGPDNCPAGTELTVKLWGAGGSGAWQTGGRGGGGGAFTTGSYTVTSSDVTNGIPYQVGTGGAPLSGPGAGKPGTPSWWSSDATIYADFGAGGINGSGATPGGQASNCIPSASAFSGGGAPNNFWTGGGGAAGPDGAGQDATAGHSTPGGAGDAGLGGAAGAASGGAGGSSALGGGGGGGGSASVAGGAGGAPGGGGGGCNGISTGPGADGQITITYTPSGGSAWYPYSRRPRAILAR